MILVFYIYFTILKLVHTCFVISFFYALQIEAIVEKLFEFEGFIYFLAKKCCGYSLYDWMHQTEIDGLRFEPHWKHCFVSLSKTLILCLVLVQPRKNHRGMTEKLLTDLKNQNKQTNTEGFH